MIIKKLKFEFIKDYNNNNIIIYMGNSNDKGPTHTEATLSEIYERSKYIEISTTNYQYFKLLKSSPNYNQIISTLKEGYTYTFTHKKKILISISESKKYEVVCKVQGFEILEKMNIVGVQKKNLYCLITNHDPGLYINKTIINDINIGQTYKLTYDHYYYDAYRPLLRVCSYEKIEV